MIVILEGIFLDSKCISLADQIFLYFLFADVLWKVACCANLYFGFLTFTKFGSLRIELKKKNT